VTTGNATLISSVISSCGVDALPERLTPDEVDTVLRAVAARIEDRDALFRQGVRNALIQALREKVDGAVADLVDAALAVKTVREKKEPKKESLVLSDPEPWPEEVDGESLLRELRNRYEAHLALPEGAATTLAVWTLYTYVFDAFVISPILGITSPEKGCGKTTLLSVLQMLVPKPLPASNLTPATVFRTIERYQPTLLVDEADTFLPLRQELIGILNSGHCRFGASVPRLVPSGDSYEPQMFSTWSPKAIALIGKLPPTLDDRSIEIPLRRKLPGEEVVPLRLDWVAPYEPLRQKSARWSKDNMNLLRNPNPRMPAWLVNRRADNWIPLFAVADRVGGAWPKEIRRAAELLTKFAGDDTSENTRLLLDLKRIFGETEETKIASNAIVTQLNRLEESPWSEMNMGKGITPANLAKRLRPFGVKPGDVWIGRTEGKTQKGYRREDLEDAFRRYLPGEGQGEQGGQGPEPQDVLIDDDLARLKLMAASTLRRAPARVAGPTDLGGDDAWNDDPCWQEDDDE
jgi:hypothetical protein